MSGPFTVTVDWGAGSVGEDVTDRVRQSIAVNYGRDQETALSTVAAGNGSLTLDNRSRDYSPRNTSSPLYGKIKPARPVTITRQVGATVYTLAVMHTDDSPINPDVDARTVGFSLIDSLADFRGITVSTELYRGVRTGEAIGYLLDAAEWTGGRDLDAGATIIPFFWVDGADAFSALQDVVASEGAPALLTIGASGEVIFRDRHHRHVRTESSTSQSTWRGQETSPEPIMAPGFAYDGAWRNVVNSVSLSVAERSPDAGLSDVWSTDETWQIPASSLRTMIIQTSEPFMDAVAPVDGVDVITSTGQIFVSAISRTSGQSLSITLGSGVSATTVVSLKLRARSVPVGRTWQVSARDSSSISDYGPRGIANGGDPVWAGRYDAEAIAQLLVLQRAEPLPILTVRFSCPANNTARLNAVLARDISDRVTVVEPETAITDAFFVESISHVIDSVADHQVTFGLEAVPASPSSRPFLIGSDSLGGTAVLGR